MASERAPRETFGGAPWVPSYPDRRPWPTIRLDAVDHGPVLLHGDGPNECDIRGARDIWVFEDGGTYYMHYDAAGPDGWLCALATSPDGLTWEKQGPVLQFGQPGSDDSATASYGVTYREGDTWHMFYLGSPNTTEAPDLVPDFPYNTMKAKASAPAGPWSKQYDVVPFRPTPGTFYSATASPGQVIRQGEEYLQFISVSAQGPDGTKRSIAIARTRDLEGPWAIDPQPIVSLEEQIENSSMYFEESDQTWYLFTNHCGPLETGLTSKYPEELEGYTDSVWVYWTTDLNRWDPQDKAVVLDRNNCSWSERVVGLPSVVRIGDRLAVYYDGLAGTGTSHVGRDVGLAWLDLPLQRPQP